MAQGGADLSGQRAGLCGTRRVGGRGAGSVETDERGVLGEPGLGPRGGRGPPWKGAEGKTRTFHLTLGEHAIERLNCCGE